MHIAVGADINGFAMKEALRQRLVDLGHEVEDFGVRAGEDVDYPDVAERVARAVAAGQVERAILVCGTGLGMAIAANKVPGVRAGTVMDPYSAERLVKSNAAQIMCLGGRVVGTELAKLLVDHFLASTFQAGDSARKVAKIEALEGERSGRTAAGARGSAPAEPQPGGSNATDEEEIDGPS
jgi:ribose 5-phosphate isomerase B